MEGLPATGALCRARGVPTPARPAWDIAYRPFFVCFGRHIKCSGRPKLVAGDFQPHRISIAAKLFSRGVSCSSLQADVAPDTPILSQERPQVNRD